MFKKLFAASVFVALMISAVPATFAHDYEDVSRDSEFFYSIDYLRRNDVFKDTKFFYPDRLVTKAEFVKYLVLLNSPEFVPANNVSLPFEDVRENAWYLPYFKEAINLGILDSRQTLIEPEKRLTVLDALTLLFHSQSIPIPNVYKGNISYTDVDRNKRSQALIMRSLSLGLIQPTRNDYVGIYKRVNRAEAARMIYKLDLASIGAPANSFNQPATISVSGGQEITKFSSVWNLIEESYLFGNRIDREEVIDQALKALVEALDDPYSNYMDREQSQNFNESIDGELEGIGAVIGFNDEGEVSVVSPIAGSPAEGVGLKAKDVILEVDGISLEGASLEEAVTLIKGPRGTSVKLKVRRDNRTLDFTIVRDLIEIVTLDYDRLNNGIYHVKLTQFNNDTGAAFDLFTEAYLADSEAKGMVIDLRGNPGGVLGITVSILGHFVEAQEEVVTIQYKDYDQVLLSRGQAELAGEPIVVLIDSGSASASEIMAGVLQDYELATVIGEDSFGKGTVQQVSGFIDDSSLRLTVAQWFTPKKQDIAENGIKPDIEFADDEATDRDELLDKALELLE